MKTDTRSSLERLPQKGEASEVLTPIAVRIPTAVRMTGIGRTRIYELIRDNEIETVKLGASRLVLIDSLKSFMETLRRPR